MTTIRIEPEAAAETAAQMIQEGADPENALEAACGGAGADLDDVEMGAVWRMLQEGGVVP